jgi:hypothetical protein
MKKIFLSKWCPLFWLGACAVTIAPWVFIHKKYWDELPPQGREVLIEHEGVHVNQQIRMGVVKWIFKYFCSRSFRFNQELEAMATEVDFWIDFGTPKICAVLLIAEKLSSRLYKASSYGRAMAWLYARTKRVVK